MAGRKKQTNKKEILENKLDLMKEVMANRQKKEFERCKNFYNSMKNVQVERKG